jgi:hypothetical protein
VLAGLTALGAATAGTAVAQGGPGGSPSGSGAQAVQGNGDEIEPGHTYTGEVGLSGSTPGDRYYKLVPGGDAGTPVSVTITAAPSGTDTPDGLDGIEVVMRKADGGRPCYDQTKQFGDGGTPPRITVVAGCHAGGSYTVEVVRNDTSTTVDHLDLTLSPAYGDTSPSTGASAPGSPGPGPTITTTPAAGTYPSAGAGDSGGSRGADGGDDAAPAQNTAGWGLVAATAFGTGTVLLLVLVLWTVLARRHARAASGS